MREIEIKARVKNPEKIKNSLKDLGVALSSPIKQHDTVYGQPGMKGGEKEAIWLRIRIENDTTFLLTLKMSVVGHLDCIEHELEISDASEMEAILKHLGFVLYSSVTKTRSKGKFGDIEICLDQVAGLGSFIEAERLTAQEADHEKTEDELWSVFSRLGINRDAAVYQGYDILARNHKPLVPDPQT